MAQGRFLSKSIATDKAVNDMSERAALVYMMTLPHLDRDGLILGDPDVLWGTVCPRRRELLDAMTAVIQEWIDSGLVRTYSYNGDRVLYFKGFQKNQILRRYSREAPSVFAPPPGYVRTDDGLTPDLLRTNSGLTPPKGEVKGEVEVEVKVEGEGQKPPPPPAQPTYRNAEHLRALGNIELAAQAGMEPEDLVKFTDWLLEQVGWLQIVEQENKRGMPTSDKLGKAQLSAITLWGLGFDCEDRWLELQDWLNASKYEPPYYLGNYEQAASAIVNGTKPPTGRKQMAVNKTMANAAALMEEYMAKEAAGD